jgi:hypothetical protein
VSERYVRLRGVRTITIVLAVLLVLMPLPTMTDPKISVAARVVWYGPLLLVAAWMVFRVSGCGLRDAGDHLVIRNPLRTVRIPWWDVASVELGRFGVMPKVGVRRTDGSAVGIFGLPVAASGQDADASTLRLMDEMRAKAQQVRSGQDQGSGHVRG